MLWFPRCTLSFGCTIQHLYICLSPPTRYDLCITSGEINVSTRILHKINIFLSIISAIHENNKHYG